MAETNVPQRRVPESNGREEAVLLPVIDTLWSYRRVIARGLLVTLATVITGGLLLRLTLPTERMGRIAFRIEMEGASQGEYPNGTKFSANDVIATPVLSQVYQANGLTTYGSFAEFASGFLIENWNLGRDSLSREYAARFADARLTPVDRARLEDEFQNKLRALDVPEYRLSFRRHDRVFEMPQDLMGKVLADTLRTWAEQADQRKGALRYNVPVLGANVLNWEAIAADESFIGVDRLRGIVIRILDNVERLAELPGADAMRSGSSRMTLAEVRVMLEELLRYRIEPLHAMARSRRLTKQPALMRTYFENQAFQSRLNREEAASRVAALEESLQAYGQRGTTFVPVGTPGAGGQRPQVGAETQTMIPQFSESFLDRMVQLSTRSEDVTYRQKLTDRLIEERLASSKLQTESAYYDTLMRGFSAGSADADPSITPAEVARRLKEAFDQAVLAVAHVNAIYEDLSKNNLNPTTQLYTVTLPFTQDRPSTLPLSSFIQWCVVVLLFAFFMLVVGSLAHHHFRRPTSAAA